MIMISDVTGASLYETLAKIQTNMNMTSGFEGDIIKGLS